MGSRLLAAIARTFAIGARLPRLPPATPGAAFAPLVRVRGAPVAAATAVASGMLDAAGLPAVVVHVRDPADASFHASLRERARDAEMPVVLIEPLGGPDAPPAASPPQDVDLRIDVRAAAAPAGALVWEAHWRGAPARVEHGWWRPLARRRGPATR